MNIYNENLNDLSCKAWILPFENKVHAAVSESEIVHILTGHQRYTYVPHTPSWCQYVFSWCDQLITLFDLNIYMNSSQKKKNISDFSSNDIICVISYKDEKNTVQYGSLLLSSLPFVRTVTDDQMCKYPPATTIDWGKLALSCFKDSEIGPIPILDVPHLFCDSIVKPVL